MSMMCISGTSLPSAHSTQSRRTPPPLAFPVPPNPSELPPPVALPDPFLPPVAVPTPPPVAEEAPPVSLPSDLELPQAESASRALTADQPNATSRPMRIS